MIFARHLSKGAKNQKKGDNEQSSSFLCSVEAAKNQKKGRWQTKLVIFQEVPRIKKKETMNSMQCGGNKKKKTMNFACRLREVWK
jgi:hypothetical protein